MFAHTEFLVSKHGNSALHASRTGRKEDGKVDGRNVEAEQIMSDNERLRAEVKQLQKRLETKTSKYPIPFAFVLP